MSKISRQCSLSNSYNYISQLYKNISSQNCKMPSLCLLLPKMRKKLLPYRRDFGSNHNVTLLSKTFKFPTLAPLDFEKSPLQTPIMVGGED